MKRFFFILVMIFLVGSLSAVQPARKPFLQIKIDGKSYKSGDIIIVTNGQKLKLEVDIEGGRKDFCKFPDTYADIAGTAEILSRGNDGITYQLNGKKYEWKLLSENVRFSSEEFIKVNNSLSTTKSATIGEFIAANSGPNSKTAEIVVASGKFSQTFVKTYIKTIWQFTQDGKTTEEENNAEGVIYFKIEGLTDVWYTSQNIKAVGMKNDLVLEKLNIVQAACDSLESIFFKLKFSSVQPSVKTLQGAINDVKTTIDAVKSTNAAYQTNITFVGLPSDNPIKNINELVSIKNNWTLSETLFPDLKNQVGKLPAQPTKESKDQLVNIIAQCVDWQYRLPENTFKIIPRYLPDLKVEDIQIPGNIHFIAEEKTVTNYPQTVNDFNAFIDKRIQQIPTEIQKLNSLQSRLQAVRLFDGMLRGYFSSINWAEWKNTRE